MKGPMPMPMPLLLVMVFLNIAGFSLILPLLPFYGQAFDVSPIAAAAAARDERRPARREHQAQRTPPAEAQPFERLHILVKTAVGGIMIVQVRSGGELRAHRGASGC